MQMLETRPQLSAGRKHCPFSNTPEMRKTPSREAAERISPQRKPWVAGGKQESPGGAKDKLFNN
jgi:hypothetical protein